MTPTPGATAQGAPSGEHRTLATPGAPNNEIAAVSVAGGGPTGLAPWYGEVWIASLRGTGTLSARPVGGGATREEDGHATSEVPRTVGQGP